MTRLAVKLLSATDPYPSAVFMAEPFDNTPASTRTFSGVNFGAVRLKRRIAVFVHVGAPSSIAAVTVTIGGVVATEHASVGTATDFTRLYSAEVPTGTSGTISIAFANTVNTCAISVFTIYDTKSPAPEATDVSSVSGTSATATVNKSQSGIVIAGAVSSYLGNSSWTSGLGGVGETSDANDGVRTWTTARQTNNFTPTAAAVAPVVSWAGAGAIRLIAAAWR